MKAANEQRTTVSVIIPTYNRAAFIQAAVNSALNQTRVPDEIIVVDDGSTDDTDRLLAQYGPPVRVIRQQNRGCSAARNVGLNHATCDAVMFLDSDDLLMPRNIEQCARVLDERPEVGVVYTDAYLIGEHDNRIGMHRQAVRGCRPSGMVLGELARRCFLTVSSMVRRSCLAGISFDEGADYAEDYDLWRRLAVVCQFQYVDEPLMCYRQHEGMTLGTQPIEAVQRELAVQRHIMAMREFKDLPAGQRARAYYAHGKKHAKRYVLTAIRLFGVRALRFAISKRRQFSGGVLGAKAYGKALPHERREPRVASPRTTAYFSAASLPSEETSHG